MLYLWLKAFHLMAVISWMAGLFYLPRLFVYHAESQLGEAQDALFQTMERKLMKIIMTPAMITAWIFGLALVVMGNWHLSGWFHGKLALLIVLTIYHFKLDGFRKAFAAGQNSHNGRFFRLINEVPTLLMIAIVLLVVLKPF